MIRDYIAIVGFSFLFLVASLISSFVFNTFINEMIIQVGNLSINGIDYTELLSIYNSKFALLTNTIQIVGIVSIFGVMISSALLVTRVRMSPLALPFAIIIYFVGIFISMAFSNSYSYMVTELQTYDSSFTINSYFDWIGLRLPYITGIIGGVLMVLAYAKAPSGGGGSGIGGLEVG